MLLFSVKAQQTHKKEDINLILQYSNKRYTNVHELELLEFDTSTAHKGYYLITVTSRKVYKDYMKDEPVDFFAKEKTEELRYEKKQKEVNIDEGVDYHP